MSCDAGMEMVGQSSTMTGWRSAPPSGPGERQGPIRLDCRPSWGSGTESFDLCLGTVCRYERNLVARHVRTTDRHHA
jgi:hypothetical protein